MVRDDIARSTRRPVCMCGRKALRSQSASVRISATHPNTQNQYGCQLFSNLLPDMKIIAVQSHQQSKSLPRTGSDQMEDPAIPGYVQLRRIWSHWILASRLHGRRQPVERPGDQWWKCKRSRIVRHEKRKKCQTQEYTFLSTQRWYQNTLCPE